MSHLRRRCGLALRIPVLLALWLPGAVLRALDPQKEITQYGHDVWRSKDGLPVDTVEAITQTGDGYLWLATEEGIARFDGVRFTVFDRRNTPAMESNDVRAIVPSRDGGLWVGTAAGLLYLQQGRVTRYVAPDGHPIDFVQSVYEDDRGTLWIGTQGQGLLRVEGGRTTAFASNEGLSEAAVWALLGDPDGSLWIGTRHGLSRFQGGRIQSFRGVPGLFEGVVSSLSRGRDGSLWIGGAGVARFKDGRFKSYTTADGLLDRQVFAVREDRDGNVWIATRGGLNRLANGVMTGFTEADGLPANLVRSLFEDREGGLWIGTYYGGLNRLRDLRLTVYGHDEGLPHDVVFSTAEDREGSVWIGTNAGLARIRAGEVTTWTTAEGLSHPTVTSVLASRSGTIWVGALSGLNRVEGDRVRRVYTTADGLVDQRVLSLYEDPAGVLWIGTDGGLSRFDGRAFTNYTMEDGLPCRHVVAITGSRGGGLWLGTQGGGLVRFADGTFTVYGEESGLPHGNVFAVYEDAAGTLWAGTDGGGLVRLADGKLTVVTERDGLFDDGIWQILEDGQDNLWMTSNRGVSRVAKRELEAFAHGRASTVRSIPFGLADGMRSAECNGGVQPAGLRGADGRLWFPTIAGVAVLDPANLQPNPLPPPVVVERMLADNEPVDLGAEVRLRPGTGRFEIQYAGLSFLESDRVRFRYRLEGFDETWQEAGVRRTAYYTNIPPGKYRFRVVAANADGVWNEEGATVELHLRPHVWQTRWFYGALLPLPPLLGWGFHRLRVRRLEGQFTAVLGERSRIAREIHDTLAQGLVAVSLQLESVAETLVSEPETASGHLDRARALVRSSLTAARRSVWDLRPEALERGDLPSALTELVQSVAAGAPVEVEVATQGAPAHLAGKVEDHLLRIAQEALANAIQHAAAQRVRVSLSESEGLVRLSICDDGCGFTVNGTTAGHFGLLGMSERAAEIGGRLDLRSAPGEGTRVLVEVPADGRGGADGR